jgi:hypothetical protein
MTILVIVPKRLYSNFTFQSNCCITTMSATRRRTRTDACWTCKLRRKKCDEARPTCGDCDSLEIACTYGPKPPWMNSGDQQRHRAVSLKNEIKRKAAYRREKANIDNEVTHDSTTTPFSIIPNMMSYNNLFSATTVQGVVAGEQIPSISCNTTAPSGSTPFMSLPPNLQHHLCLDGVGQFPGMETDFIMKYMDFVFPALFPFYRPSLFETGRSWLLILLGKSKVAYHSAICLAYYYFTMVLTDDQLGEEYAVCKQLRWKEVEEQTKKCFDSLKMDVLALNSNSENAPATKLERVDMLGSIIQVLIFELALGQSAPWNTHLPPAVTLLHDIMDTSIVSNQCSDRSRLTSVLLEIGKPLWSKPGQSSHIWSPDQAGFRFYAGFLTFIDTVASTATKKAPRLLSYHADILAGVDDGNCIISEAEVRLSAVVGCRKWVMRSIAEITVLSSWKAEQIGANNLYVAELNNRASGTASHLRNNILPLENECAACSRYDSNQRQPFDTSSDPSASSRTTLIWAHAAYLYLMVVVHGWQPTIQDIKDHVAHIMALLRNIPTYQLRTLAWPLCVAGCLAQEPEETFFADLFSESGRVYTVGALDDARQIMKKVWQNRPTLDADTWDFASCFSILGSPILLV